MRVIHFPGHDGANPHESTLMELEAALCGEAEGQVADSWRQLREDVRALAPSMSGEFERALDQRIAALPERRRRRATRLGGRLGEHRLRAAALAMSIVVLLAVALAVRPWSGGETPRFAARQAQLGTAGTASKAQSSVPRSANAAPAGSTFTFNSPAPVAGAEASAGAAGRLQEHAASVTLGTSASEVQAVADGVAHLAVSVGGFVQRSQVQVRQEGSSGAELTLSVPSAKLDNVLASLGRLAPLRAESRSAQDITNSYETAKRRVSDLQAERQALLRALSAASTQGQIDSLRERLSGVSHVIAQARTEAQSVARQAATSEVEVTVEGNSHPSSEGFTVHRGLNDAGHVLLVTLTVLLIGAAVLVPLALVIAVLGVGLSAWRRYRRERVLDAS